jgi:hypothetical protein
MKLLSPMIFQPSMMNSSAGSEQQIAALARQMVVTRQAYIAQRMLTALIESLSALFPLLVAPTISKEHIRI